MIIEFFGTKYAVCRSERVAYNPLAIHYSQWGK